MLIVSSFNLCMTNRKYHLWQFCVNSFSLVVCWQFLFKRLSLRNKRTYNVLDWGLNRCLGGEQVQKNDSYLNMKKGGLKAMNLFLGRFHWAHRARLPVLWSVSRLAPRVMQSCLTGKNILDLLHKAKQEKVWEFLCSGKPISVTSAGQAHRVTKATRLPASFLSNQPLHSPALVKYI